MHAWHVCTQIRACMCMHAIGYKYNKQHEWSGGVGCLLPTGYWQLMSLAPEVLAPFWPDRHNWIPT
jgi:hypothetical protein